METTKSVKGIPKAEKVWEKRTTENGDTFYITAKENDRSVYFIYKVENGAANKLGKSKSPRELVQKYTQ